VKQEESVTTLTTPTDIHVHDDIRELRRVLGDETCFAALRCVFATANTWHGETHGGNRGERYMQMALDLKHAGVEARARAAANDHAQRHRVEVDWHKLLFSLAASGTNVIQALEQERAAIAELLHHLRQPAPRG
jgi:hypothetical protein